MTIQPDSVNMTVPQDGPTTDQQPSSIQAPPGGKVITLPSGFRVALRNPAAIRNRERKWVYEAVAGADESNAVEAGMAMTARITALIITAWDVRSVDDALVPYGEVLPIPRDDMEGLEDMPMGDVAVLDAEAEVARNVILPDFSPSVKTDSPTSPSGG